MSLLLKVENVAKSFYEYETALQKTLAMMGIYFKEPKNTVEVLQNVSFELKSGEALAIIGKNGSGKSTLLEMIAGTVKPTAGSIQRYGSVYPMLELGVGFNMNLTGRQNIELTGLLQGKSLKLIRESINEVIDFSELGAYIEQRVSVYSSGMLLRLAFAMVNVFNPDILIIDEALTVGDYYFQKKCYQFIKGYLEEGGALLFVSHDMTLVRGLCSKAIVLSNKRATYHSDMYEAIRLYHEGCEKREADVKGPVAHNECSQKTDMIILKSICLSVGSQLLHDEMVITIGDILNVDIVLEGGGDINCNVNVIVKNIYGSLLNITTSEALYKKPVILKPGKLIKIGFELDMLLEAGAYTIQVSITTSNDNHNENKTILLSEEIGPVRVEWNHNRSPAPFYGQFGLPAKFSID